MIVIIVTIIVIGVILFINNENQKSWLFYTNEYTTQVESITKRYSQYFLVESINVEANGEVIIVCGDKYGPMFELQVPIDKIVWQKSGEEKISLNLNISRNTDYSSLNEYRNLRNLEEYTPTELVEKFSKNVTLMSENPPV